MAGDGKPPNPRLFTIGYEGAVQEEILDRLLASGVRLLIDVRAIPMSRKPGFSKRLLAGSAAARGIEYRHIAALGTPKPGRQAARAGRGDEMARIFNAHLATETAQAGLADAIGLARDTPACLLCFERDPHLCHRTIVAERIAAATGQAITAL